MTLQYTDTPLAQLVAASDELDLLRAQADRHGFASRAENTRRAYESDWALFAAWCERYELCRLPTTPETVRLYVTDLALQARSDGTPRYRVSSIRRHVAAISRVHFDAGYGQGLARTPAVTNVVAGIARTRAEARRVQRPLLLDDVGRLVAAMRHDTWPEGVAAARDTFALLLGFATALRRSEEASLTAAQVVLHPVDGLHVRLGASKSDQEGAGVVLAAPYGVQAHTCVPCAWAHWVRLLAASERATRMRIAFGSPYEEGDHVCRGPIPALAPDTPLFPPVDKAGEVGDRAVSGAALNEMVKRRLAKAGYDPAPYGFHSLRAGMVTQARRNGATAREVRRQTRHGSDAMVDVYDREHLPLAGNAVTKLGL